MKTYVFIIVVLFSLLSVVAFAQNEKKNVENDILQKLAKVLPEYEYVGSFDEGFALVTRNDKYGIIDKAGEEIVPCIYSRIGDYGSSNTLFSDGLVYAETSEGKTVFINKNGKIAFELDQKYSSSLFFSCGRLPVWIEKDIPDDRGCCGKLGFMDKTGKMVIPNKYDIFMGEGPMVFSFSEGLYRIPLDINDSYTILIDTLGNEVIKCKGFVIDFHEGMAKTEKGFIDKKGKLVVSGNFVESNFSEGLCMFYGENNSCGFMDKTGKMAIPAVYELLSVEDGPGLYELSSSFHEGLAWVCKNGKYGYIDTKGNVVIPFQYEPRCGEWGDLVGAPTSDFHEGMARIWSKQTKKYGFIDRTGKKIVPCQYDDADNYSEGLARVEKNGKYGFIDKTGKEVVPCIYDFADNFYEGLARVEKNGKYGFIDKTGNSTFDYQQ